MRSGLVAMLLLGTAAAPTHGQEADSIVAVYQQTLLTLRDSTIRVRSSLNQFRRDLQLAGAVTVVNRAARLNEACAALQSSLVAARPVFRQSHAPHEGAREASRNLLSEIEMLETALGKHCLEGLAREGPGVWADSLKAWGPYHAANLQRALAAYDGAAGVLARTVGIRLRPPRTGVFPQSIISR